MTKPEVVEAEAAAAEAAAAARAATAAESTSDAIVVELAKVREELAELRKLVASDRAPQG